MCNYYLTIKNIIIFILCVLFSSGCMEKEKKPAENVLTFRKENAILLNNSDFFKNRKIISLEVKKYDNDYSLINKMPCIKKDGENIFIYSRDIAYPILRFDMNGNFKNKIGNIGNGPNEFVNVKDVTINREKSTVEILADYRIICFSFDGAPIEVKKYDFDGNGASSFTYVDNEYWLYTGNNTAFSTYRLYQTDQNFNIIQRHLSDKSNMLPLNEANFKQSPYNTFRETFYHNMYAIQNNSLALLHTVKFPGMEFPSEIHKLPPLEVIQSLRNSHYASILCYLENDNFIYMFVVEYDPDVTETIYHWTINKNNNQERIIKTNGIDGSYLTSPQLLTDDNFLYFLGYPIENENDDINPEENPSVVIINLSENFK